jgi:hypothetical protein
VRKKEKTMEARTSKVNLSHPKQETMWRQISHFGGLREQAEEKALKLKLPK